MSGNIRTREKESIRALVELLRATEDKEIGSLEWLDGHQKGDGLPEARALPYLIEHVSIDSTPDQRKLGAQFLDIINGIDREFADVDYPLRIAMPEGVAQTGRDRKVLRQSLIAWLRQEVPRLPDGFHKDVSVPGFGEYFCVWKNMPPSRYGIVFCRFTPPGPSKLSERIADQVRRKAEKLLRHRGSNERAIILIESEDSSLMDAHTFLNAFSGAFPSLPAGVDNVWFCHSLNDSQCDLLNTATGHVYLLNTKSGCIEGETWIAAAAPGRPL
jgi:hypothetical protein